MTAPVSLDKKPIVKEKPTPLFAFLRYPGSWFYLIVTSVLGLFWILGLTEATRMIACCAIDPLQKISSFEALYAVLISLVLGLNSVGAMSIQLKFSKVGPTTYLGFRIIGWLNFSGWLITGLIGIFTLPNPLFICFLKKLFICGVPLYIWFCWSYLHELLMNCCARRHQRLSSVKDCPPA